MKLLKTLQNITPSDKILNYEFAKKITIFFYINSNTSFLFELALSYTNLQIIKKQSHFTNRYDAFLKNNKKYDNRKRLKYLIDEKKKRSEIFSSTHPNDTLNYKEFSEILYPLGGISNVITVHCNELGFWKEYKSDRYGFNNPDLVWDNKYPQFFMIGDSFLHGECVKENETFAGIFRSRYGNNEIVNLGYRGTGSLHHLAQVAEYLNNFKPKNILWFYYEGNDILDTSLESKNKFLSKYQNNNFIYNQNLMKRQTEIDYLIKNLYSEKFNKAILKYKVNIFQVIQLRSTRKLTSKGINKLKKSLSKIKSLFPQNKAQNKISNEKSKKEKKISKVRNVFWGQTEINMVRDAVLATKKISDKNGINFYFIYLPEFWRYELKELNNIQYDQNIYRDKGKIITMLEKNNINYIDLDDELFAYHDDYRSLFPFRKGGHYNPEGYKQASKLIIQTITKDK